MLADLLKIITPEALTFAIRNNPVIIMDALNKIDAYISFGKALSTEQQLAISKNLDKLDAFFKDDEGKISISILAEEFTKFVERKK